MRKELKEFMEEICPALYTFGLVKKQAGSRHFFIGKEGYMYCADCINASIPSRRMRYSKIKKL